MLVLLVLAAVLILFAWNRWRYDVVALMALLFLTVAGIIAPDDAFMGFAHPAVITVAAVLVITRGLLNSGLIDVITKSMAKAGEDFIVQLAVLTLTVAVLSAFMNNIGAMALMLPIAVRMARKHERPASLYLMPLAFGSLLGGLVTLIGTPPNIVIAMARAETGADPFGMFDFAPVGLSVLAAGLLFIVLLGWRLIPQRDDAEAGQLVAHISDYVTELKIPKGSEMVSKRVMDLYRMSDGDIVLLAIVRRGDTIKAPSSRKVLNAGDILIVRGDTESIKMLIDEIGLELGEGRSFNSDIASSEEVDVVEVVVSQNSPMIGRKLSGVRLHERYGVNLLALARQGRDIAKSLESVMIKEGDLMLLQGPREVLASTVPALGLLPLASGEISLGRPRRIYVAVALFASGLLVAAAGLLPIAVALMVVALAMILIGLVPAREIYSSIDWPIIILLGAMIPVGGALDTVGGTTLIAEGILSAGDIMTPHIALLVIMVATMLLSNIVNNAAVAVLMAPIAIETALRMGVSADPMLMAVAIGASCAFLTPIGHQSNTLVMGPGGYRFTDYWPMGLPMQFLVIMVSLPMIFIVWPF